MSKEVALRETKSLSLFPSEKEWAMLKEQATIAVKSGFLPRTVDTPEKAIAIALKGRELGIPPMHAFAHIHIIDGKPTISAELMLSLIHKNCPGAIIEYPEKNATKCVIRATRPGTKAETWSFTIEEAKQAGLLNKSNWKNYPAAMLRARAVSLMARAVFPDALMGCSYTPEELGAKVNEDGEVVDLPPGSVHPNQPGEEDGDPDAIRQWTFRKGKFARRNLREAENVFGLEEMRQWVTKNEEKLAKAKQAGQVIQDQEIWEEDIEICAKYIADRENGTCPFELAQVEEEWVE